ncbi:MAG: phosphodiester glycosidase family protein [Kofleriaceae bacterium]
MSRTLCVFAVVSGLHACNRREPAPAVVEPVESAPAPVPAPAPVAPTATTSTPLLPCPVSHASLGPGLEAERWQLDAKPATPSTPPCVDVVRADATRFTLKILSTDDATNANARDWLAMFHLSAVTNAGMFHESGEPVGLVVADGAARSNNNSKMSGYLAWDPVDATDPPITIAGRDCPGFDLDKLRARYHSIVQSYRLLGCDGGALPWKDPKQYSAAAIGLDRARRIVFLHARAAVTMAELSKELASHDLVGALFLEGGPEASLVAKGSDGELAAVGSYETNFVENDDNRSFWALPNVIGLLPR